MLEKTLTLLTLGLALGACSSTHYVSIRHPLHVGQVDPNQVPFEARSQASARGLPAGTLVDTASLSEVTPERICVRMSLWSIGEDVVMSSGGGANRVVGGQADRGVYQNYRIAMLNDQEGVEMADPQIQLEQPVAQAYQGHISRRIQDGTRRVCADYQTQRRGRQTRRVCVRWRREPVYRTIYEPHVWQVTSHPANVCFNNGGFITPSTTRVALEVDASGPARMTFEWQFESAVAGGPPPQQQN